jgi:catechol 2,3-dioxygenase-like lactoylglutathione lyase family enzyme
MRVEHADFIAVPVADLQAADAFYGEVLGLARNPAYFTDPDGNALVLHHRDAAYPDGSA